MNSLRLTVLRWHLFGDYREKDQEAGELRDRVGSPGPGNEFERRRALGEKTKKIHALIADESKLLAELPQKLVFEYRAVFGSYDFEGKQIPLGCFEMETDGTFTPGNAQDAPSWVPAIGRDSKHLHPNGFIWNKVQKLYFSFADIPDASFCSDAYRRKREVNGLAAGNWKPDWAFGRREDFGWGVDVMPQADGKPKWISALPMSEAEAEPFLKSQSGFVSLGRWQPPPGAFVRVYGEFNLHRHYLNPAVGSYGAVIFEITAIEIYSAQDPRQKLYSWERNGDPQAGYSILENPREEGAYIAENGQWVKLVAANPRVSLDPQAGTRRPARRPSGELVFSDKDGLPVVTSAGVLLIFVGRVPAATALTGPHDYAWCEATRTSIAPDGTRHTRLIPVGSDAVGFGALNRIPAKIERLTDHAVQLQFRNRASEGTYAVAFGDQRFEFRLKLYP